MQDASPAPVAAWEKFIAVSLAAFSLFLFTAPLVYVPGFESVLKDVGSEMPAATAWAIGNYGYFVLPALLPAAGLWLLGKKRRTAGWALLGFGFLLALGLTALIVVAMYLPVFEMGQVVEAN